MTIKQHGGIFGRNPTFKDVDINGNLVVDGSTGVGTDSLLGKLHIEDTGEVVLVVSSSDNNGATLRLRNQGSTDQYISNISGELIFLNGSTEAMRMANGNLVIANSGNGIDFSATGDGSGTATSELFDDYEEGAFTPAYTPATGAFGSITYDNQHGEYTKIGNIVNVRIYLRTDALTVGTASGIVSITGLPYAPANNRSAGGVYSTGFGGDSPDVANVSAAGIDLYYRSAANGGVAVLDVSDLGTGTNDNNLRLEITYEV